jgi:hypothetical protein
MGPLMVYFFPPAPNGRLGGFDKVVGDDVALRLKQRPGCSLERLSTHVDNGGRGSIMGKRGARARCLWVGA